MSSILIHGAFDVLAWLAARLAAVWLSGIEKVAFPAVTTSLPYLAAILLGAGVGGPGDRRGRHRADLVRDTAAAVSEATT
jgi:hypothetical protein